MPAAVALLKEQRPHVYLSFMPRLWKSRDQPSKKSSGHSTPTLFLSNQGQLITAEVLLRDTNLQRFFEIIATDLTPAELGESLLGRQAFKSKPLRHNKKSLVRFFGKHTDGAKMS